MLREAHERSRCFGFVVRALPARKYQRSLGNTVMVNRPFSASGPAGRDLRRPARHLLRSLIGKTLAFFVEHEDDNLTRVREHLMDLLDARPSPVRAQNLRSARQLLHKQADVFNRAFQAALQTSMDEEMRAVLPEAPASAVANDTPADPLDGMTLSLIDVCEVERILLLDRVAQRFTAHYDASVSALTQRLGVLLGRDVAALSSNPFRPEVFVRAFLLAWENSGLDNQATEDLMLALDPLHSIDLTPLYADLNAMLTHAGIAGQPARRVIKSEGAGSSHLPLSPASAHAHLQGGEMRSGLGGLEPERARSAWDALAPAGRSIASHARQFLQRLGLASSSGQNDSGAGEGADWTPAEGHETRTYLASADPEFMGYLGDLQAGAQAESAERILPGQHPGDRNVLRQMRDRDEVRRAPELDRGGVDDVATFAVGFDQGHEGLQAPDHAPHIDVDGPAPVLLAGGLGAAAGTDPRIVDEHMDLAEGIDGLLGGGKHRIPPGHVGHHARDIAALGLEFGDRLVERGFFDIAQHHFHAGGGKRARHAEAHAAGGTGDEGHFTCYVFHADFLLLARRDRHHQARMGSG